MRPLGAREARGLGCLLSLRPTLRSLCSALLCEGEGVADFPWQAESPKLSASMGLSLGWVIKRHWQIRGGGRSQGREGTVIKTLVHVTAPPPRHPLCLPASPGASPRDPAWPSRLLFLGTFMAVIVTSVCLTIPKSNDQAPLKQWGAPVRSTDYDV